jgi:acyl-CoA synthetase (NDP forming)
MSDSALVSAEQLQSFFHPRSIALVGATDNSRWSLYTYQNLRAFHFPGALYLINPRYESVHGQRAYKSLSELPETVDLAFVMVPTSQVLPVIAEGAGRGVRHFVILTAGFAEIGGEGSRLEQELLTFARARALTILGPNGNGFINATAGITPYGLPIAAPLRAGPVGIILQSGALASAVLAYAQAHAIGLSLLVSMGNESMIAVSDVLDYLLEDPATRAVALFLESIRQPQRLRQLAQKARERHNGFVALKIGRSEAASRSARAHTGALVGNDAINDAVLRQLGIIRVSSLEDLLTTAALAAYVGPLSGRRMGAVTPSGGACDIIADRAQDEGISLPEFTEETQERLRATLPPFATPQNPLDVTGYVVVDGTLQQRALAIVRDDPACDFILNLVSIDGLRQSSSEGLSQLLAQYDRLAELVRTAPRPVLLASNTCLDLPAAAQSVVERTGLHFIAGLEHGLRAIGRLLWWSEQLRRDAESGAAEQQPPTLSIAPSTFGGDWSEARTRRLLAEAGIPLVPAGLVTTAEEAVQAAQRYGFPVVLKIQSPALPHKSDVGGVALNLSSPGEVRAAFNSMLQRIQARYPESPIEGVLVSPMRPAGVELLVSAIDDPLWGLTLTVGLGGIWTELLRDVAMRALPVTRRQIAALLEELRGAALLDGARGGQPVDRATLCEVIHRITLLAGALAPRLALLEINPLWAQGAAVEVLDALVIWRDAGDARAVELKQSEERGSTREVSL